MRLTFITLIILVLLTVYIMWLGRYLSKNLAKDHELNRLRSERTNHTIKRVEQIAVLSVEMEQLAVNHQLSFDEKLQDITSVVNKQLLEMDTHLQQFEAMAKSDMLSARRDELIRTKELKIALERIISMNTMSRQEPSAIDQLAIESVTNRIVELEAILK